MIAPGTQVPVLLAALYAGLSVVTYFLYWLDKAAAQRGTRRTPEKTLHLFALLGGWPGALAAQRQFRHKTRKQPFQAVFWVTVVVNLAGVAWLLATRVDGS